MRKIIEESIINHSCITIMILLITVIFIIILFNNLKRINDSINKYFKHIINNLICYKYIYFIISIVLIILFIGISSYFKWKAYNWLSLGFIPTIIYAVHDTKNQLKSSEHNNKENRIHLDKNLTEQLNGERTNEIDISLYLEKYKLINKCILYFLKYEEQLKVLKGLYYYPSKSSSYEMHSIDSLIANESELKQHQKVIHYNEHIYNDKKNFFITLIKNKCHSLILEINNAENMRFDISNLFKVITFYSTSNNSGISNDYKINYKSIKTDMYYISSRLELIKRKIHFIVNNNNKLFHDSLTEKKLKEIYTKYNKEMNHIINNVNNIIVFLVEYRTHEYNNIKNNG